MIGQREILDLIAVDKLRAWAASRDNVGRPGDSYGCPVACYLRQATGHLARATYETIYLFGEDDQVGHAETPPTIRRLMARVDELRGPRLPGRALLDLIDAIPTWES